MRKASWQASAILLLMAAPLGAQTEPVLGDSARFASDTARVRFTAAADLGYVRFSDTGGETRPWQLGTLELAARARRATVVGRVNYAERFGQSGVQFEADAYPRLGRRLYAYLNAGVSGADIFPERRFGAELFASLPRAFEVSAGARRLEFTETDVTLYTASLAKYVGNYYLSARPFVSPQDDGTSVSATVLARRYFRGDDSYATLVAGAGRAPTESTQEFELGRTRSYRLGAFGRRPLGGRVGVRWSVGGEYEELDPTRERRRFNVGLGADTRF